MSHPVDVLVGRRIAELRTAGGLSGRQLATALGVSAQQVQKYESGCNRISASRLWLLTSILDVQPHAFFEGADATAPCGHDAASSGRNDVASATAVLDVARNFRRIEDPEIRDALVRLVGLLSDEQPPDD